MPLSLPIGHRIWLLPRLILNRRVLGRLLVCRLLLGFRECDDGHLTGNEHLTLARPADGHHFQNGARRLLALCHTLFGLPMDRGIKFGANLNHLVLHAELAPNVVHLLEKQRIRLEKRLFSFRHIRWGHQRFFDLLGNRHETSEGVPLAEVIRLRHGLPVLPPIILQVCLQSNKFVHHVVDLLFARCLLLEERQLSLRWLPRAALVALADGWEVHSATFDASPFFFFHALGFLSGLRRRLDFGTPPFVSILLGGRLLALRLRLFCAVSLVFFAWLGHGALDGFLCSCRSHDDPSCAGVPAAAVWRHAAAPTNCDHCNHGKSCCRRGHAPKGVGGVGARSARYGQRGRHNSSRQWRHNRGSNDSRLPACCKTWPTNQGHQSGTNSERHGATRWAILVARCALFDRLKHRERSATWQQHRHCGNEKGPR
mmetsp:Transcript_57587/g.160393  ORF Transcript_57587/g.160393 Transcript_57587/m.160393 type:complete len:427 (-) Transcript_57587:54-1334(-)